MVNVRTFALTAVVAVAALPAGGCGTAALLTGHRSPAPSASASASASAYGAGVETGRRAVAVVRGWSDALRRGDVRAAAGYFALPSLFADGSDPLTLHSLADAVAANTGLTCGSELISVTLHGPYLNALFRLTQRSGPGGGACGSGTGQTARAFFLIRNGRILEWLRVPDLPGDNATPGAPGAPGTPGTPGRPGTPTTPTSPSPTVPSPGGASTI
jgi:hypothetical protein